MKIRWYPRVCQVCGKNFMLRACYARRSPGAGRFCSRTCQTIGYTGSGNPKAGKYAVYGSKVSEHRRQLDGYQRYRTLALAKLAKLWETKVVCIRCGCDHLLLLQVNHRNGRGRSEASAKLWRKVIKLSDADAKNQFDIRCFLCNWAYYVQMKYRCSYQIAWGGLQ